MSYIIPSLQQQLQKAHDSATCINCGGDASEFSDDKSTKEYHISGLCQQCQDEVFNV